MRALNLVVLASTVVWSQPTFGENSVVYARASRQELVQIPSKCGIDTEPMCVSHPWFRWTLSVRRTLSGPPVAARVIGAHGQNRKLPRAQLRSYRVFVLEPIDDELTRANVGADYYLVDFSAEQQP